MSSKHLLGILFGVVFPMPFSFATSPSPPILNPNYKNVDKKSDVHQIPSSFDSSVATLTQLHDDPFNPGPVPPKEPVHPPLDIFDPPDPFNPDQPNNVFKRSHNSKTILSTLNDVNPIQVANSKEQYLHNPKYRQLPNVDPVKPKSFTSHTFKNH